MRILGHRGSCVPGPENTLEAVSAALAAGADGVEVDARRTADERLVLSHDPVRAGVTLIEHPYDPAVGAPLLSDLLDACRGHRVIVEIKNVPAEPDHDAPHERTAELLAGLLRERAGGADGAADDVVVSSFDWFAVERVRADLAGAVPTAFLITSGVAVSAAVSYAVEAGHAELHVPVRTVLAAPAEAVARCHDAGLGLVVWTVTTLDEAKALAGAGVDGIICDDPAAVVAALR
ncbi:MAG TPA: glycerophosphodiester phosphodiesterase [Mycobacteriales bacterium]|nr:glycerophosphodiester phosphodiesterase [Mycobacteriales bacterium]